MNAAQILSLLVVGVAVALYIFFRFYKAFYGKCQACEAAIIAPRVTKPPKVPEPPKSKEEDLVTAPLGSPDEEIEAIESIYGDD